MPPTSAEVAGFKSEWWPASARNPGRLQIGIHGRIKSESPTSLYRSSNTKFIRLVWLDPRPVGASRKYSLNCVTAGWASGLIGPSRPNDAPLGSPLKDLAVK